MLGIADEDGWVQILDSRRTGSRSVIKGMCKIRLALYHCLFFFLARDMHLILDTLFRVAHVHYILCQ